MLNRTLFRVLSPAALVLALGASAFAQSPIGTAPAATATIQQVAFIAGQWTGTLGDRTIEQHWMAPLGTSMVAMYRNVQGTEPKLYELLAIEQEGTGLVLRIKHFAPGAGLAGRQPQGESINHKLVKVEGQTATFEGIGENPNRVIFTRKSADDLDIVVERMRDGKVQSTVFAYTKVK
ncbi:MAG TPA: DUF6265 family protein [Luteitalea sp.]|nr:DUF6265 family protein [Luteitalea sp.]